MNYAVIDLETTGLDQWRSEVLEIACIVLDEEFKEISTFHEYVRPEYSWSEDAKRVHGISRDQASRFRVSDDVISEFCSFLAYYRKPFGYRMVAHAKPLRHDADLFDRRMLFSWFWNSDRRSEFYNYFREENVYSTIKRKRSEAEAEWGLKSQRLSAWADKLGIEFVHHRAIEDARLTVEVLKYQMQGGGIEWEEK